MKEALEQAREALTEGEVPIGAVAVRDGRIISRGRNRRRALNDITAHAEMMCLRNLDGAIGGLSLAGVTVYSTLEPCAMCAGALVHYGASRVVYGAKDVKLGAAGSAFDILGQGGIEAIGGILETECRRILEAFFEEELGQPSKAWEDIELE